MGKIINVLKIFFEKVFKKDYDIDKLTATEQKEVIYNIVSQIRNSNELF